MIIRKTVCEDLSIVMEVYDTARAFMIRQGNTSQWWAGYPSLRQIEGDIANGVSYVCTEENGAIVGTFYYAQENDPTYLKIYNGNWLNDEPYGVIHRIASNGQTKGIMEFCVGWCLKQCPNLRIDTHRDNLTMRHILAKLGFTECGIIYISNGDERIAYQLTSPEQAQCRLKKNSLHKVKIGGISSTGSGVTRVNGRVVFVKDALEGELCDIKLLKVSKNISYAKIENIIEPSPHRIEPLCPHFRFCGGCNFLHASYDEELRYKAERVHDALSRIGGLNIKAEEIIAADSRERYRNKAVYTISGSVGNALTGFYRARTHEFTAVSDCLIQSEFSHKAAQILKQWMNCHGIMPYSEQTGGGIVRKLLVRTASNGTVAVCVIARSKPHHLDKLIKLYSEYMPEAMSLSLNINKTQGNTVLSTEFYTLYGEEYLTETLCGLSFKLSPASFFQINTSQAERLYNRAIEYASLTGEEELVDLYCGTGTISLVAARNAKHVTGIELSDSAVNDACGNAVYNGIDNVDFICADATAGFTLLRERSVNADVIILDPPRKGLSPELIKTVSDASPERVVYISCNPATLARDLRIYNELGYTARRLTLVDMFPATTHVESVVLMTKEK